MKRRRRRIRHTNDEPQEQEEEEKSNNFLRGSMRTTSKRRREGGQERVRRWDYMNPFSRSSFGLASEDWLREFNRMITFGRFLQGLTDIGLLRSYP